MQDKANRVMQGVVLDNRYRIDEKIGVGGMAVVYKGEDFLLGRAVAIKILHDNFAQDDAFVAKFRREAQAAGKLSHPNIVNMYDVGQDQGYHYIVMEYVEGETLKEYILRHTQLSIDAAVKFTIAIAEGLEHAHTMGIVHCDIKPHNIIITPQGRVKVTDFGIARAMNTANTMMYTNSVMGSAHYLSPEQAAGKPVDGSTDIYSLGVVLYEMLTGRVPYEGESAISVALKHVRERLTPPTRYNPHIPPLLEAAVIKALAKQPEDRFSSIGDMINDLRLSQGFVNSKSTRLVPHDFATQVIPDLAINNAREVGYDNEEYDEEGNNSLLARLGRLPRKYIVIGSGLIFLLAFLWAFLSFGNFWSNASVDVPNVVGKQVSVAKHILEDNHLRVSVSEVTNPDVPAGRVISQSPEAGSNVKEQRTIHLVVSKGPGDINMPDLRGLRLDDAKDKIKELGLVIGKITVKSLDNEADGVILEQDPAEGSKLSKGSVINITVNRKQIKKISVPNVTGMTLKEAKAALDALNLGISQVSGDNDEKAVIIAQKPAAGSSVEEGTSIVLTAERKDNAKKTNAEATAKSEVQGTVDITVPAGAQNQAVRIVVADDGGKHVVYEGTRHPGDRVVKDISGTGSVRVQVYLNNVLVQDQAL